MFFLFRSDRMARIKLDKVRKPVDHDMLLIGKVYVSVGSFLVVSSK